MRQAIKTSYRAAKIGGCLVATCILSTVQLSCNRPSSMNAGVGGCSPPAEYTLAPPNTTAQVLQVGQEQDDWCWAASGQMILGYYGQTVSQCKQVNDRYPNIGDCCSEHPPAACGTKTGWPQFCKHKLDLKIRHNQGLQWNELKQEIGCRKTPIAFTWHWADGVKGHMMVAFGYESKSQSNVSDFLWVRNPLPVGSGKTEKVFYADYLPENSPTASTTSTVPIHKHWDDFYDFQTNQNVACTNDNSE
jgi:Papain-like cysteine protease AvrRpt2